MSDDVDAHLRVRFPQFDQFTEALRELLRAEYREGRDAAAWREAEWKTIKAEVVLTIDQWSMVSHALYALEREYARFARIAPDKRREHQAIWWSASQIEEVRRLLRGSRGRQVSEAPPRVPPGQAH